MSHPDQLARTASMQALRTCPLRRRRLVGIREGANVWQRMGLLSLLAFLFSTHAAGQDCVGGRVASEQTAGRCCWPAQSWDDDAGRCAGPPACPAGMVGEGATCVAPAPPPVTAVVPPVEAPTPAVAPRAAPRALPSVDDAPLRADEPVAEEPRWALVATGIPMLVVGWIPMAVAGAVLFGGGRCSDWAGANFAPVVGGATFALGNDLCGADFGPVILGAGYASTGVQVIGLILLIAGLSQRRSRNALGRTSGPPELPVLRF